MDNYDLNAERALIGCILTDDKLLPKCKMIVPTGTYFYDTRNQAIWSAILDLATSGMPVDEIIIKDKVIKKFPQMIDLPETLVVCMEMGAMKYNAPTYAKIVRDKYVERCRVASASKILNSHGDKEVVGAESVEMTLINRLLVDKPSLEEIAKIAQEEVMMSFEKPELTTGVDYIDYFTAGLQRKKMTTFAGRTNQGKTAWAVQSMAENLKRGRKVAYYTFDITAQDIMKRLVGYLGGIDTDTYIKPWKIPNPNDRHDAIRNFESIMSTISEDYKDTLIVRSRPTQAEIEGDCGLGVDVVYIDYLQVAMVLHKGNKYGIGQDDWIAYLDWWKTLAEKYNFAVVPLSQFKRANYEARGKQPDMEDLKESGYIETSAHAIVGLWWQYMEDSTFFQMAYSFRVFKANGEKTNGWDYIQFTPNLQRFESGTKEWRDKVKAEVMEWNEQKRKRGG